MNAHELKQLQVRLTKAKAERDTARAAFEQAKKGYQVAMNAVESLESQINRCSQGLVITEHALLRFIERSQGVVAETIEDKIRSMVEETVKVLGDGRYPLDDGLCAVVKNNVVVTVEFAK